MRKLGRRLTLSTIYGDTEQIVQWTDKRGSLKTINVLIYTFIGEQSVTTNTHFMKNFPISTDEKIPEFNKSKI